MITRLMPKLALASLAAIGLFLPFSAPLPGSCLRTFGVAGAAPSPSCGGDLRECLRLSANLRETTFGGRYVTADDVARCVETFNACIHGGASAGGNSGPSTSTSAGDKAAVGLPQRFRIDSERPVECRVSGDVISCNGHFQKPHGDGTYTETYEVTGAVSGRTMTGTLTGRSDSTGFCISHTDFSAKVTYDFSPDGTVEMRQGPAEMKTVYSGGCSDSPPSSSTSPSWEATGNWSPLE